MNSFERRKLRYQRRKHRRMEKKIHRLNSLGSFDDVFTYLNLYEAFRFCKIGVRWKSSIQSYEANLPINTYDIYKKLKDNKWKSKGFTKFTICERGKMRDIQSVHISERCIQRCFCDNYLVPATTPTLIYDNGASLKGKGVEFEINRLKKHIKDYFRKYGNDGYVVTFDFTNYFGNIDRSILYQQMDELFLDEKLKKMYHKLIDAFDEGLGLGSQVSQISAVAFANKIDHYFKDFLGVKYYARYMDDIRIIEKDLDKVNEYISDMKRLCKSLSITLKDSKIKVCKISHGFTFLKKRISVSPTGKINIRLSRKSIKAVKRRLRKMNDKLQLGKLTSKEILNSYKSWRESVKRYKTYYTIKRIDKYFNRLFIDDFVKKGEYCYG